MEHSSDLPRWWEGTSTTLLRLRGTTKVAFTVGDVSGKGVAAAVLMASIQMLLRSLLQESCMLPRIFNHVNKALFQSSTESRYCTLVCCVIDAHSGDGVYINAGHVRPLLRRADGGVEELLDSALPLGLIEESTYRVTPFSMGPNDVLLLVSDGIYDLVNAAGEFWNERVVIQTLCTSGELTPHLLVESLASAADDWAAGADQHDDMTMVAVRMVS